jgi:hypothetical protein
MMLEIAKQEDTTTETDAAWETIFATLRKMERREKGMTLFANFTSSDANRVSRGSVLGRIGLGLYGTRGWEMSTRAVRLGGQLSRSKIGIEWRSVQINAL